LQWITGMRSRLAGGQRTCGVGEGVPPIPLVRTFALAIDGIIAVALVTRDHNPEPRRRANVVAAVSGRADHHSKAVREKGRKSGRRGRRR
jgi:hypothetical protein